MYGQNEGNNEEMGIKRLLIFGIQTEFWKFWVELDSKMYTHPSGTHPYF